MLVYVAAPYSNVEDKANLMQEIARISGKFMQENPKHYAVTGLVHHYAVQEVKTLGTDWNFWQDFCEEFLSKCDILLVCMFDGWLESRGVREEIKLAFAKNIPCVYIDPYTY